MTEPTDAEIIALNAGEIHFSESPTKYPEAGHGTQYHAGAPGVLSFARAVLAWGTPVPKTNQCGEVCERAKLCAICARGLEGTPAPVEPAEFSQFLSDVMTAAGLVTHGKQCKDLGVRLGDMCLRLRAAQVLAMVPLTDEWIRSRCKEPWIFETAKQWVRMAEEAHGIKQGGA